MDDKHVPQQNGRKLYPPLRLTWDSVTEKNVKLFQRLNTAIFPIKYNDGFYKEAIHAPAGFSKLAFFNEVLVASVCCRKERFVVSHTDLHNRQKDGGDPNQVPPELASQPEKFSLYILTLGVLAPYRERGIGSQLINQVFDVVKTSSVCKDVADIYVHVQVGNDDAIRFYRNFGFEITETLVGYYKRLDPADCVILRKPIDATDVDETS